MKVLILHTDLRVYWKRRLGYLRVFLKDHNISFYAIELFGKGSPYAFDTYDSKELWWHCLFPDKANSDLSINNIKKALFLRLSEINPDVIIAGSIAFYSGALGLSWAKAHEKKFIMFDDAKPSNVKRNFLVQGIKNLITNSIDGLWLPSKDYDYEYSLFYDKKGMHFFYGFNAIDNKLFRVNKPKKFDNNKIICVARLVPIKNIENLLNAWKSIEQVNNVEQLIIIGDGPLLGELRALSESLALERVTFLGVVTNDEIPHYLFEADAFILPSWSESWGLVVNEAMAAGLPVLLSDKINAANTLLKEGVNGYSFNPGDANELKQKLLQFINLPVKDKGKMSAASLKIIDTLSYENMGEELLATLKLIEAEPMKKIGWLAATCIRLWKGRYNTAGWDKL